MGRASLPRRPEAGGQNARTCPHARIDGPIRRRWIGSSLGSGTVRFLLFEPQFDDRAIIVHFHSACLFVHLDHLDVALALSLGQNQKFVMRFFPRFECGQLRFEEGGFVAEDRGNARKNDLRRRWRVDDRRPPIRSRLQPKHISPYNNSLVTIAGSHRLNGLCSTVPGQKTQGDDQDFGPDSHIPN